MRTRVNFHFEVNMDTRFDFTTELLSALEAATEVDDARLFMKAAVALRGWYRHEALAHKPELVVSHTADVFEVYGDVRVERQSDGTRKVLKAGVAQLLSQIELSALGRYLAYAARFRIQKDYREKVKALINRLPLPPEKRQDLCSKLDAVDEQLGEQLGAKLNVNWWRRKCTLADDSRVLGKLLWDSGMLDRRIFSLATRVGGFRFPITLYNECLMHQEELTARIEEAPHMAPWLRNDSLGGKLSVHQTVWKDLKDSFVARGGTAQTWKWLCNQGHKWFRFVSLDNSHVQAVTAIAALQLGKVPFDSTLFGYVSYRLSGDRMDQRYLDVFKAAMVAHKKRKLKVAGFADVILIRDFLDHVPFASTKGSSWASLMRKQQVWHRENARREVERRKAEGGCLGWAPMVQMLREGNLEAISLNNSDELWEEGAEMSHCVGGYDQECFKNESRIYSIRRNGERVSTLEIRKVGGKLTIGQNYGPGNTRVRDEAVGRLANAVLAACRRAPELNPADNKVLREPYNRARGVSVEPANDACYEEPQAALPF